jgi:penicillin-binding protein 1A
VANTTEGPDVAEQAAARPRRFSIFHVFITVLVASAIVTASLGYYAVVRIANAPDVKIPDREPGILVLANDGNELAKIGNFEGSKKLGDLPDYVEKAILAVEDRRFYEHNGFDFSGLIRATLANIQAGRVVEGGSTITQQLAKNLFLTSERSTSRKLDEAYLTIWLEQNLSKDEILELYLDRVYFGAGATGIEAAAQAYFRKTARELSLSEAAALAAVLKAPTQYNPITNPDASRKRAEKVIGDMVETGAITAEEASRAAQAPIVAKAVDYVPSTQYAVDWTVEAAKALIGEPTESIIIETTIDRHLHEVAEKALVAALRKSGTKLNVSQGAIVVMDVDGSIRVMVGGKDYLGSQFNRAAMAKRQPGSAFKPFVYLAALEAGKTKNSQEVDEPIEIAGWKPENYDGRYRGSMSLEKALTRSVNTIAVKLADEIGPDKVASVARRLGIKSPLNEVVSLSLGTSEVTLLELTNSYIPFANGGRPFPGHTIRRIATKDGKVLYEAPKLEPDAVVADRELEEMQQMLLNVVEKGTARAVHVPRHRIAGKTGTSQEYRDAWFIGFNPGTLAGIWIGNDDNSPMLKVTGGSLPAEIFDAVMTEALKDRKPSAFEKSPLKSEVILVADAPGRQKYAKVRYDFQSRLSVFGYRPFQPWILKQENRRDRPRNVVPRDSRD